jgi:hypothetical protein
MKQQVYIYISVYLLASSCLFVSAIDWSAVDKILEDGIKDHTYPGCVAAVGDAKVINITYLSYLSACSYQ